ncbi:hypothetical protein J5277_22915 [Rhizobium sp. 16-449-1b]|uniref:hypothetical protein n=1 Tax=Rhizobium sp. 16-449-1b TaxID=2819989 RepID=UPI001ADC4C9F|nr:hypothetical protein [Rhizobium sp. 16-449-1b]MBO9196969.1 hypothetical protein [Rhizobium sp. 16-449-1b]
MLVSCISLMFRRFHISAKVPFSLLLNFLLSICFYVTFSLAPASSQEIPQVNPTPTAALAIAVQLSLFTVAASSTAQAQSHADDLSRGQDQNARAQRFDHRISENPLQAASMKDAPISFPPAR